MKKFTSFPIKYPVTVSMIVIAIILLGYISFGKLGTDLFPDLSNPRIFIEIEAGEKPPEEIEKKFIKPMEANIMRLKGVNNVSSITRAGASLITVEYGWKQDMDEAFLEIQKSLGNFEQNGDIDELNISRHDPNSAPVLLIALQNKQVSDPEELRKTANGYIRNEIIRLEGVADMKIAGETETEVEILTNEYLLNAYGANPDAIAQRLQNYNRNISGGSIVEMGKRYIIKGNSLINNVEDIKNLIITYRIDSNLTNNPVKTPVFLKNMATVELVPKKAKNIVRLNGEPCLGLYIYKENKYNTVKVIEELDKEMEVISKSLPGYEFTIVNNQGKFINASINEVKETALIGIILAVFILFVFLRRIGSTLIVSIAIPISIIATFNLMYFNGLTLNIMTLGGLALGAGMLVDNAIIVLENIFRNREEGLTVRDAAITGTGQVSGAITASTLTTIVVFLPIVYLQGASGELFKDQAWTVAFSLLSSLFVAILFIPLLYTWFYPRQLKERKKQSVQFTGYMQMLGKFLSHRYLIGILSLGLIALAVLLVPVIGSEYFPKSNSGILKIEVDLPQGTRLERTSNTIFNIENIVQDIIGDELDLMYSHAGPSSSSESSSDIFFQDENTGNILVKLKESGLENAETYIKRITSTLSGINGLEFDITREESSLKEILGTEGPPVEIEVTGENIETLEELTKEVLLKIDSLGYLYATESTMQEGSPQIEIKIDRYRAGIYDIQVNNVVSELNRQLEGTNAGELEKDGEQKDIVIRYPELVLSQLTDIKIQSGNIKIPITEFATLEQTSSPKQIVRDNQNRVVKISSWIKENKPIDHVSADIENLIEKIDIPAEYSIKVTGEEEKRKDSFGNLAFALILSVILVYMVMASQFESLLHPFTILLTIPLAGVGSILLFFFMGQSLNVMAYIGIIMLAGIAVNDSIILVDAINQYKASGHAIRESILLAGQQRIRPIIMTSLTTILALVPLTLGIGESTSLRAPMALAVIGGLVTSTLLTLIVIPCVYMIFEEVKIRLTGKKQQEI